MMRVSRSRGDKTEGLKRDELERVDAQVSVKISSCEKESENPSSCSSTFSRNTFR